MSARIIGIDPGTIRLGYGILEAQGVRARLVVAGTCSAPRTASVAERLGAMQRQLRALVREHQPSCLAMESSFHGRNAQAMLRLGEARGLVLGIAADLELPVHDYAPALIKKAVTGHGNAAKPAVARMVGAMLGATPESLGGLDATDALAVALCHAHRLRMPTPKANVAAAASAGRRPRR